MSALHQRVCAVEAGPASGPLTRYEGMDLRFDVRSGASSTSSGVSVVYWMPPAGLVGTLGTRGTICRVLAGYADQGPMELASGTIVRDSVKDLRGAEDPRVEWEIHPVSRVLTSIVSVSMPGPVQASAVLEEVRQQLGIPVDVVRLGEDATYVRGYVYAGGPRRILDDLARDTGSKVELDGGRLRVWPLGEPARQLVDLWTSGTGLVEASGPADRGRVTATALLRPSLRRGDLVRIQDRAFRGDVEVERVGHVGIVHGDAWHTQITGRPL